VNEECTGVMIYPEKTCVPDGTAFNCSATDGHPGQPSYNWVELESGTIQLPGALYTVQGDKYHWLQCAAKFSHAHCPDYSAACRSNITVKSFG